MINQRFFIGLALCSLFHTHIAQAGSIFDNTPFEGVAKTACNATGTCNLQQKAGLPNIGGDIGNFFEQAKKNAGPLVTTITTLNCPGCVVAAGVVSGPGAVQEALFTTGIVTAAYEVSPALGFLAVVVLAADKDSGEVGYEQVTIAEHKNVKRPNPSTFTLPADCLAKDRDHVFALFLQAPELAGKIKEGDTVNLTAPICKQMVSQGAEVLTATSIKKTGGNSINMSTGRFTYVITGTPINSGTPVKKVKASNK